MPTRIYEPEIHAVRRIEGWSVERLLFFDYSGASAVIYMQEKGA